MSTCCDEDVQRFIVSGYLTLPPSEPTCVHAGIAADIHACGLQELNGGGRDPYGLRQLDGAAAGNNLLHAAPALRGPAFLESPALTAALSRLLGPGYRIHPHCRGHLRQRSAKTSMWHVDAYKGLPWCSGRNHEPHWLMILYYPQDTTDDMGPTQLLPGSQYYRGDSDRAHYSRGHIPDFGEQQAGWATNVHTVVGCAGTIVVMHYDLWHRALASASDAPRLMLKFVACRTAQPELSTVTPPRWPLAEAGAAATAAELAAEPLLNFLSRATSAPEPAAKSAAHASRRSTAGARRFDRQVVAATETPTGAAVSCELAGSDVASHANNDRTASGGPVPAAVLPSEIVAALEALLAKAAASGEVGGEGGEGSLWAGIDLLTQRGATDAEKSLFASAVAFAKLAATAGPRCDALGSSEAASAPHISKQQMPAVLAWLAPRCAAAVRDAADTQRRSRFVADRAPLWQHTWAWLHGCATVPTNLTAGADDAKMKLRIELRNGAEPSRLRAAYELAATPGGGEVLLSLMSDAEASTSIRRTAMFGAVAAGIPTHTLSALVAPEGVVSAPAPLPATDELDPVLALGVENRERWLSASVLRSIEGFDAELLLAAASPPAEVAFLASMVLARSPTVPDALDQSSRAVDALSVLLALLDAPDATTPPSARLAALEACGTLAAASRDVDAVSKRIARVLTHAHADAGTRALAARAFMHLGAQGVLTIARVGPDAKDATIEALAVAAASDPDRYVRGYAVDALASVLLLEPIASGEQSVAMGALEALLAPEDVAAALHRRSEGDDPQVIVRWLCARRWCPLTTPEAPF